MVPETSVSQMSWVLGSASERFPGAWFSVNGTWVTAAQRVPRSNTTGAAVQLRGCSEAAGAPIQRRGCSFPGHLGIVSLVRSSEVERGLWIRQYCEVGCRLAQGAFDLATHPGGLPKAHFACTGEALCDYGGSTRMKVGEDLPVIVYDIQIC